jgi:hypothetical protein
MTYAENLRMQSNTVVREKIPDFEPPVLHPAFL